MTDPHEMRMVNGRIRAVYTQDDGDEYTIQSGERVHLSRGAAEHFDDDHIPEEDRDEFEAEQGMTRAQRNRADPGYDAP